MSSEKSEAAAGGPDKIVKEARRQQALREKTYRERALRLFPWVCGHCGREFSGKKLQDLTVHHKDHNHDNNPPDGSNWELLCIYCHDNEHDRRQVAGEYSQEVTSVREERPTSTHKPFADLGDLLRNKK